MYLKLGAHDIPGLLAAAWGGASPWGRGSSWLTPKCMLLLREGDLFLESSDPDRGSAPQPLLHLREAEGPAPANQM